MSRAPEVWLKAAITLDGKIASRTGDSRWITSKASRTHAHRLRAQADAVLVGIGTVLADDPLLNVRHVEGPDPRRVVLDGTLRMPESARVLAGPGGPTTVFHGPSAPASRRAALTAAGARLHEVPGTARGLDLPSVLRALGAQGSRALLVEGGARVHGALLDAGLVDRVEVFVAPRILGDAEAPSFAGGRGSDLMAGAWALDDVRVRPSGPDLWWSGRPHRPGTAGPPDGRESLGPGLSKGPDEG
ncbi:MAG: RibD family protein [Myxococcota bacterium]